jgi:6-phosphogluconolactonase
VRHIYENGGVLFPAMAEFFVEQGTKAIGLNGKFTVALSGGSSPQKLYSLLASPKYRSRLDWDKVLFFFGDERFVPSNDVQSNYRMAKETLFDPLGIPPNQVFAVNTTIQPEESARAYEDTVRKQLGSQYKFDLILLGLGDDAHTASLFPHSSVLTERHSLVKEVFVGKVNQYRITFTEPLINAAKVVAFLLFGSSKADAVYHIMKSPYSPEDYPAQLIKPVAGELHWFMDSAATGRI